MYVRKINEIQIIFGMKTKWNLLMLPTNIMSKETIAVFSLNIYKLGHGQVNGTLFSLAFFSHSSHGSTLHCCPLQKQT